MTAASPMESGPVTAVRAVAAGLYSLDAACELVIGTGWLRRSDFTCFVRTGTSLTGGVTELARIDRQAVIAGREPGLLPPQAMAQAYAEVIADLSTAIESPQQATAPVLPLR